MPSLRTAPVTNSASQVDNLIIKPSLTEPEVIKIRILASKGNFSLIDTNNSIIVNFGDSADKFKQGLNILTNFGTYNPNVTMAPLVATGGYQTGVDPIGGY